MTMRHESAGELAGKVADGIAAGFLLRAHERLGEQELGVVAWETERTVMSAVKVPLRVMPDGVRVICLPCSPREYVETLGEAE